MHVRLAVLASILGGSVLVLACQGAAPAPATQPAAEPAKVVAAEPAKVAAAEPAKHEGEEGCIYADAHGKKEGEHADEADCPHGGGHGAAGSGEPGHFGAAFALKETRALGAILAAGKDALPKEPVQVSATVDTVCQKKGCWMVVKDGDQHARILMKDHSFTVPMDTKGKPVVVEGTLEARTFSEAQVKHLEKDGGGDPATASGERTEFVITASGVKIANS